MLNYSVNTTSGFVPVDNDYSSDISLNALLLEYPCYGTGDYITPVFHAKYQDGSTVTKLYYKSCKIYDGKPTFIGLPSTYVEDSSEAQTLEVTLYDELTDLTVVLIYTAYNDRNVITRSAKLINGKSK